MRRNHPTIAAQVTQDAETQEWTKTYHQSRDEADAQSWLEKTLVSVSTGQTGEKWANSDPPAPKLPTLFNIHVAPKEPGSRVIRHDLVLRSPHGIADGVGTLILLSNLIAQASKAYDEGDGYQVLMLDVLAFCKSISATPTHVFHAAAALVMRDPQDRATEAKRVRYMNFILRNERSSCAEPYNTTRRPAALYPSVSGQSLVVDMTLPAAGETPNDQSRREEFLAITQIMKEFYHSVRKSDIADYLDRCAEVVFNGLSRS
ncbi:hypothetical protein QQZ08_003781 [Neonectria magnoliae]|uniref:Uncharacterized protein n=1 Tax=Neonectria magnoliae TaxID=2732573 RepID=A0ABR1I9S8_9HYPO